MTESGRFRTHKQYVGSPVTHGQFLELRVQECLYTSYSAQSLPDELSVSNRFSCVIAGTALRPSHQNPISSITKETVPASPAPMAMEPTRARCIDRVSLYHLLSPRRYLGVRCTLHVERHVANFVYICSLVENCLVPCTSGSSNQNQL